MTMSLPHPESRIPHRGRWSLLDRLVVISPSRVVAVAKFTLAQAEGHFPGRPVVPGVLLLEALAQTMLCIDAPDGVGAPFLAGIDRVRFRAPVIPPAEVVLAVSVTDRRGEFTIGDCEATCDGVLVCTARLTGALIRTP